MNSSEIHRLPVHRLPVAAVASENDTFRERNGDLNFRNGAPVCSETLISARVRASREPGIVFAADVCSVAKIQVPVSQKKTIVFTADVCSVGKKGAKRAQTSYQKVKNGQKSGTDGAYVCYEK